MWAIHRLAWIVVVWVAASAAAQTITVRNDSFEEGEKTPAHWSLSGEGTWADAGAAYGKRCIVARGNGEDASVWRLDSLTLEAEQTYVMSVMARRVEGSGGVATIGPPFANFDLHDLTQDWKRYEVIFRTPSDLKPAQSYLRLGQWHMKGAVAFDDVRVRVAEAIHRTVADQDMTAIPLGAGEVLRCARGLRRGSCIYLDDASEYEFRAVFEAGNEARTLFDHTAGFNTNRWVFSAGQHVTYRHRVGEFGQKNVSISVSLSYHTAGSLIVEASGNQRDWVKLGVLESVSSATFGLPENFKYFRDDGIWIRLRAEADKNGRAGFQVSDYRYFANVVARGRVGNLPRERRVHFGTTHWLKVISAPPRVDFKVESIGGDAITEFHRQDGLVVSVSGDPPREATITLEVPGRAPQRVTRSAVDSQQMIWSYPVPPAGKSTLRIEMATRSGPYLAEIDLQGSESEDGTWGRRLESSNQAADLWWCSSGRKVSPTRGLPVNEEKVAAIELKLAANESEAVQLVVRPKRMLGQFIALPTDLEGPDGQKIAANQVEILRVEYVSVSTPTDRSGTVGEWPDPLPRISGDHIEEGSNYVLWIRVRALRGTQPGLYSGSVRLRSNSTYSVDVPLRVQVYDFELPDRLTCSTAFGFSPSNVFKYQRLEKTADRRAVLEKYWANFSAHHISPYDPAPLDPFKITWPAKDARVLVPSIDWTRWDAAMTRAMDVHHFNSFRLTVQGLGAGTFHERVEPSLLGFGADSPQYRALMKNYLGQLQEHLKEKGWLDRAFVYWFDEPDPKDYEFVNRGFARLKEDAPGLRRMLTEQVEEKLVGGPTIWCPVTPEFNAAKAGPRMAAGEEFWWYVCTGPKAPYATLFIDHPATEMRVWLWQTWQRGIKGILVWETNYWTSPTAYPDGLQDPYDDPMSWQTGYGVPKGNKRPWGNGDGRFIYPPVAARDREKKEPILEGPVDSIRWEMLRDGLEDYEYLVILQRLLKDHPDAQAAKLLEVSESITYDMTTFTKDPSAIEARRDQIARAIERLSRK